MIYISFWLVPAVRPPDLLKRVSTDYPILKTNPTKLTKTSTKYAKHSMNERNTAKKPAAKCNSVAKRTKSRCCNIVANSVRFARVMDDRRNWGDQRWKLGLPKLGYSASLISLILPSFPFPAPLWGTSLFPDRPQKGPETTNDETGFPCHRPTTANVFRTPW